MDKEGFEAIQEVALQSKAAAAEGRWEDSTSYWYKTQEVVQNRTNGIDWYNILHYDVMADVTGLSRRGSGVSGKPAISNLIYCSV